MTDQLGQSKNLPAELLAKVSANISPPLNGTIEDFQGIVVANRHLKDEVEGELIHNMTLSLEDIMNKSSKSWHSLLRIAIPTSISDIPKVNIAIPKSYFRSSNLDLLDALASLLPLLDLHISSITVMLYEDEKFDTPVEAMRANRSFQDHMAYFIQRMLRPFTPCTHLLCNIKTIAVRWDSDELM